MLLSFLLKITRPTLALIALVNLRQNTLIARVYTSLSKKNSESCLQILIQLMKILKLLDQISWSSSSTTSSLMWVFNIKKKNCNRMQVTCTNSRSNFASL